MNKEVIEAIIKYYCLAGEKILKEARLNMEKPKQWLTPIDTGLINLFGVPVKYDPYILNLTLENQ